MHKKVISLIDTQIEGVAGKAPAVIALTEDGKVYIRRLTSHTKGWSEISITDDAIIEEKTIEE